MGINKNLFIVLIDTDSAHVLRKRKRLFAPDVIFKFNLKITPEYQP